MKHLGPHSRPGKLAILDGRRAEARRMKQVRLDLEKHVGTSVSVTQRMLIQRIAILTLRMELMDAKALKTGNLTERDAREYLAWNNTVSRMLRQLGLKGAADRTPSIADYIASRSEPAAA